MQSLFQILMLLLDIVWFVIVAHVIMSALIERLLELDFMPASEHLAGLVQRVD